MRFVFVHGTGVRSKGFHQLFPLVSKALIRRFPDADVVPCYWGDEYGATLSAGGASIPGSDGTRGDTSGGSDAGAIDQVSAEWFLLVTDPWCELRVLAELPGDGGDGFDAPGVRAAGEQIADRIEALAGELPASDELDVLLRETGLAEHYPDARTAIAESVEFAEACGAATDDAAAGELAAATSRAVVARMLAQAGCAALCTGDERDRLVDVLGTRLGGTGRWPGSRAAAVLGALALRMITQPLLDHWRTPLTSGTAPALGDILRYQARGLPLRDHLERVITSSAEPTVVIGHSLGGIALVDLLALAAIRQKPLSLVKLLVTVGSQAPYLHELGALAGLLPCATLPPGFPHWLNIFDRRDLLAYQACPVFPGDPRVIDREVSSRQPFPFAHSAYWKLDAVYDRIMQAIEGLG